MKSYQTILITDVGSTTTKAVLIQKRDESYEIIDLKHAATTVEKPDEDVTIGVKNCLAKLSGNNDFFSDEQAKETLTFTPETCYITTSSAGGGLQILVIGLTKFDTASSAERAAFGAGGVILDTFAIDDKRSALEQMVAMRSLQPDIILMAGGVEDGAFVPILRLAEILQIAEPTAKFSASDKIPFVFAGNSSARPYLHKLIQEKFEWHPVANIRPTILKEDLTEAQEKIHELFMNNVMERAPGYPLLKKSVADDIIPTPIGVMRTLQLLNEKSQKNVMMVDIGGATTDIFSNIFGQFFRTVSANYGMSYSIANVMKDVSVESIRQWTQSNISGNYIQNYIANKMLYPTYNPASECELMIEQAVGREAIRMSKLQHLAMNFNKKQIGFLEKLKKNDMEKIVQAFYFEKALEKERFQMYDFDVIIGAGGLISHTSNKMQALSIIMEGFQPDGITEIWRDNHFISPHLGKLSELDKEIAEKLITEQCFEILGIVIRPVTKRWKESTKLLSYKLFMDSALQKEATLKAGEFICELNPEKKELEIEIKLAHNVYLTSDKRQEYKIKTTYPLVFDGRITTDFTQMNSQLQLFSKIDVLPSIENAFLEKRKQPIIKTGTHFKKEELPYEGEIFVIPNEQVKPDSIIGENRFAPPKIFFISLFDKSYLDLNSENIRDFLQVKEGDEVNYGTKIIDKGKSTFIDELKGTVRHFASLVRGRVETINYEAGTILLKEIQDYSTKPVQVKVSEILQVKPEEITRYIKRKEGDFIYGGELLASRVWNIKDGNVQSSITDVDYMRNVVNDALSQSQKIPITIPAPTTGKIKKIDLETGRVTIHYDKEPYRKKAFLFGTIKEVKDKKAATLAFDGTVTQGIIGFGKEAAGILQVVDNIENNESIQPESVVVYPGNITVTSLAFLKEKKVSAVIAASIHYEDLRKFTGEDIGVALTGNENIPFPLILTEGFGNFDMHPALQTLFRKHENDWCYTNGHTQIRAGVIRPEIILQKIL